MSPSLGPSLMKSAGAHVSRVHLGLRLAVRKGRMSLTNHPLRSRSHGLLSGRSPRVSMSFRRPRPNVGMADHSVDWQIGAGRHIIEPPFPPREQLSFERFEFG